MSYYVIYYHITLSYTTLFIVMRLRRDSKDSEAQAVVELAPLPWGPGMAFENSAVITNTLPVG